MHQSFDVVVVGSGAGAMTGALLAAKAGLSTVVVEKTPFLGGTSAYSGGALWLPGSAVAGRAGIDDSTDSARRYLHNVVDDIDEDKMEAFLAEAPRLVAELESDGGFDFDWVPFPEYFNADGRVKGGRSIQVRDIRRDELPAEVATLVRPPVDRDRAGAGGRRTLQGGQALIARLTMAFLREGGTVLTQHSFEELVRDRDAVVGIVANTADSRVTIGANRAVLLAAGGFEGNATMRAQHGVPGHANWTMGPAGTNAGESIVAGAANGGAVNLMDQAWFCPGLEQPGGGASFTLGFRGGIMVDANGQRYANECLPYDRFGREMAKAPGRVPSWLVFDAREGGRLPAIAMPEGAPEEHLTAGTWVTGRTLDDLASLIGVSADALTDSVGRFNVFADKGVDEDFGRGDDEYDTFFAGGDGPNRALVPISQPPFFAARFVLCDLGTKGGLVTDTAGRVVRDDGSVISGLYASGNTAASLTGTAYPGPGVPLGTAMVMASLAVNDICGSDRVRTGK